MSGRTLFVRHFCQHCGIASFSQSPLGTSRSVGLLGHQVRESALLCLNNCPLLADMAEWSHWDLIYKPELGELKDFVHKNGGVHSFVVPGNIEKPHEALKLKQCVRYMCNSDLFQIPSLLRIKESFTFTKCTVALYQL